MTFPRIFGPRMQLLFVPSRHSARRSSLQKMALNSEHMRVEEGTQFASNASIRRGLIPISSLTEEGCTGLNRVPFERSKRGYGKSTRILARRGNTSFNW